MKKTLVATTIIVATVMLVCFSVLAVPPTNDQLGQGMINIGTQIAGVKDSVDDLQGKLDPSGSVVFVNGTTIKNLKMADRQTQERFLNIAEVAKCIKDEFFAKKTTESRREEILKDAQLKIAQNAVLDMLRNPQKYPEAARLFNALVDARIDSKINTLGVDGKVSTAVSESNAYTDQVAKTKLEEGKVYVDGEISKVSTKIEETNKTLADSFETVEAVGKDGTTYKVSVLKLDRLPQDVKNVAGDVSEIKSLLPKDKDGKLVLAAKQSDLDRKADQSYVDTEIARVETNVADNIDNLRALALKKDKAFIFVYASYMLRQDEQGFREWLKPQVKKDFEEKFNEIKSKAQEAKDKKIVKF